MLRKFRIDILSAAIVLLLLVPLVWKKGDSWLGLHAPEERALCIVIICGFFALFVMLFGIEASSRRSVAMRRLRNWLAREFGSEAADSRDASGPASRHSALRRTLVERHGRRWRYQHRWLLVTGDKEQIGGLAPGLIEAGYLINGDVLLLHADQASDTHATQWLQQIRQMRRRRPVDAVVVVLPAAAQASDDDTLGQQMAGHVRALRWSAPVYLVEVHQGGQLSFSPDAPIGVTWSSARIDHDYITASLQTLSTRLADSGVTRLARRADDRITTELSRHVSGRTQALVALLLKLGQSALTPPLVHGLLFASLPLQAGAGVSSQSMSRRMIWEPVSAHSRHLHGHHVGLSLSRSAAWVSLILLLGWIAGSNVSGFMNRTSIQQAAQTVQELKGAPDAVLALPLLGRLDRHIDTLEQHLANGLPWMTRFGLNQERALLDALWPHYGEAARQTLVAPLRDKIEERLFYLGSLSDKEIANGGSEQMQASYDALKAYLMLGKPAQANAAFLTPLLLATQVPARPHEAKLSAGAWEDARQHAIRFFSQHLASGRIAATEIDPALVAATRQTIISVRGIQNSTEALYQQILDEAQAKYPPVSLAMLLGETSSRGLFTTAVTIPGVFTRAAWDERIGKAIDEASEQRNVKADWVLSDAKSAGTSSASLKAELRQRYFDDYARAWQAFLNDVRWQASPSLSGTADQLALLADPQRSPLLALMNVVVFQAGAGAGAQSLSDALLSKAHKLIGSGEKDPSKQVQPQVAPLAAAFGPVLQLTGSDLLAPGSGNDKAPRLPASGDLSLVRYLERVTAMRLKVAQIVASTDPDAMARLAAQSVLQGKTSEISDSRDYASRVAASLGEQWSGFGAFLRAPFDQSWQVIVQPAASSLNEIWRSAVVADWNRVLGGRYPFADSDNDASLPEMARFMRVDNGVITQFVTTQLAGVVERQGDRWVAAQGADQGTLTIDPVFLESLNRMTRIATVLFPGGDARVRYELQATPTPGVTDTRLILSGRELHYFNQKQEWLPFEWPGQALENVSRIEWVTQQGGLRTALDAPGRFGLIRLLERATVEQQDGARYLLTWMPESSQSVALRVQLRSDAGAGPLEVLQLRGLTLPQRIFSSATSKPEGRTALSAPALPALPHREGMTSPIARRIAQPTGETR